MNIIRYDSTVAQGYDITNYLDSKLAEIPKDEEITIDLSGTAGNKLKRQLPEILERIKDRKVVKLDLSNTKLSENEMGGVANAIASHPHMRTVILNNNEIRDVGAKKLADALKANPKLEISILDNRISGLGAVAFVKAMVETGKTEIDLSGNNLSDSGAKAVAEELGRSSNNVEKLVLKNNRISTFGDRHLALNVPGHIKVFYRTGSVLDTCPGMSKFIPGFAASAIDYLASCVKVHVEDPEGCVYRARATKRAE